MTAGETGPSKEAVEAATECIPFHQEIHDFAFIIDRHFAPLRARVEELERALQDSREAKNRFKQAAMELASENLNESEKAHTRITILEAQLAEARAAHDSDRLHWMHKLDEVVAEKRDVCELRRLLDNQDGLIHQIRSMLREAGFPDRIKMGEDLHGNEDWAPVRVEAQLKDAITQLTAAQAVVRALEPIAAFAEVFAGDIGSRGKSCRNHKVGWLLVKHVIAAEEALSTARAAGLTKETT